MNFNLKNRTWDRKSTKGLVGFIMIIVGLVFYADGVIDVCEKNSWDK